MRPTNSVWIFLLALLLHLSGCGDSGSPLPPEVVSQNNTAVGHMGRYEYEKALAIFQPLAEAHPDWLDGQVNLALATLNRQQEGDEEQALAILEAVLARDASNIKALYLSGFLLLRAGNNERAADRFMAVVSLDPDDGYGWYHYGIANEQDEPATALLAYKGAVRRDPYLRSGWYRLGQIASRLGEEEMSKNALETFSQLEENPRAAMVKPVYGRLGPHALAATIDTTNAPTPLPEGPAWLPMRPLQDGLGPWRNDGGARTPTAADLDGDGDIDLFIAGAGVDPAPNAVLLREDDGYQFNTDHPLASVTDVAFALFGDLDNSGTIDVYLGRKGPNVLLMQDTDGTWNDRTNDAEVAGGATTSSDGAMVDIDHDGDLDILVANIDGPMDVFANTLDGPFRQIGDETGLSEATNASQLLIADLDHTSDLDVLAIRPQGENMLFFNNRLWKFARNDTYLPLEESNILHAVAGDINATGRASLYTIEDDRTLGYWWLDNKGRAKRKVLKTLKEIPVNMAILDQNGDGQLEVLTTPHPSLTGVKHWTVLQQEIARGPAIVAVPRSGEAIAQILPPGPGRHAFTGITLSGAEDPSQQMRSNASGIGAQVAARRGTQWTIRRNLPHESGPGQNSQPMVFGLGGQDQLDFVLIDWPDGLLQTELAGVKDLGSEATTPEFTAGNIQRINETQRQVSSCPVLFAHDGTSMRFVSDVLGVGGIGYLLEPGTYNQPRPFERFIFPNGALAPDEDDRLRMVICEPMEEVCYLDAATLSGWILPDGWNVVIDERMAIQSEQPSGREIFFRGEYDPVSCTNDRGQDVLAAVRDVDFVAAPIGPIDRRFIGRLEGEHILELAFDCNLAELSNPVLLMDGWVEYPYSQTMFASWQAGLTYNAPTLEARDGDGTWHVIHEQFGYPAGMPRTAAMPLGELPEGTTAIRLRTNQEIYWDRLRIIDAESAPQGARQINATLASADFQPIGYPRRLKRPQRRPDYDFADRAPLWDARHQRGLYTEFGEVADLLTSANQEVVTIGPGEGVTLSFELPEDLPRGMYGNVHWILDAHGWCKDRDRFTRDGETLEPLPAATPRATRMETGY